MEFLAAGFDEALFWQCTPRQVASHFKAAGIRRQRDHNDRAWAVWHFAALTRAKRLPPLSKLLVRGPTKPQSPDEMKAAVRAWLASRSAAVKPKS